MLIVKEMNKFEILKSSKQLINSKTLKINNIS